jgi:hypothetical protein
VLAAYSKIILTAKIATATVVTPPSALIISGAAAIAAISHPIKCVIALPGSLIVKFIQIPPNKST